MPGNKLLGVVRMEEILLRTKELKNALKEAKRVVFSKGGKGFVFEKSQPWTWKFGNSEWTTGELLRLILQMEKEGFEISFEED